MQAYQGIEVLRWKDFVGRHHRQRWRRRSGFWVNCVNSVGHRLTRKPVSGYKLKEIIGSGIFPAGGENHVEEADAANPTPNSKTGLRMYQQTVAGISHISFGEEETVSPKKATSEAKQRELSGNLDSESEARLKKQISVAKNKELSGHNIFAPPPEISLAYWLLVHWL